MNLTDKQKLDLSHGFNAGNYDNAHVSTDMHYTLSRRAPGYSYSEEFQGAYVLGFFSSYERHEIPARYLDQYEVAVDKWSMVLGVEI